MPKIVHFEVNADDPSRAKSFYENAFGWKIEKWEGPMEYWLIEAGDEDEEGINGGLMKREEPEDQIFNYIQVSNVDETKNKIEKGILGVGDPVVFLVELGIKYPNIKLEN